MLPVLLLAATPLAAQDAPRTVIVVRHAEKGAVGDNPSLTPEGTRRAEELSRALEDVRVTALFATEFLRTQETLRPLARRTGVAPQLLPARDVDSLVGRILALPAGGAAVVASHSNLVHLIVQKLTGVSVRELADRDYDRLYVLTVTGPGKGTALVLRYGEPASATAAPMRP